jgi:glutamine cyclotransferase
MWLYKQGQQMLKWKDPRTSNVETQVQVNVSVMGIKEGIRLRWSQGFGLDELDV